MHNIELKVRCSSQEQQDIEKKLRSIGARYIRTLWQRDTYFKTPNGRLKLREWQHLPSLYSSEQTDKGPENPLENAASGAILISYNRPDEDSSRISEYQLYPVDNPTMLRDMLTSTMGIHVVVTKQRTLYMQQNTRVHLDLVHDLGTFIELETLVEATSSLAEAQNEHQQVIITLGLNTYSPIPGSYSDLLLYKVAH